jgi:small subunit ribosomal protein S20
VASHESALKAHRQNIQRREHNRQLRTRLRGALRDIRAAIDAGKPDDVREALRETTSLVDKMASKGIIHSNTAGRYKSRLAARLTRKATAA